MIPCCNVCMCTCICVCVCYQCDFKAATPLFSVCVCSCCVRRWRRGEESMKR